MKNGNHKHLVQTSLTGPLKRKFMRFQGQGFTGGGAARVLLIRGLAIYAADKEADEPEIAGGGKPLRVQTHLDTETNDTFLRFCGARDLNYSQGFRLLLALSLAKEKVKR